MYEKVNNTHKIDFEESASKPTVLFGVNSPELLWFPNRTGKVASPEKIRVMVNPLLSGQFVDGWMNTRNI